MFLYQRKCSDDSMICARSREGVKWIWEWPSNINGNQNSHIFQPQLKIRKFTSVPFETLYGSSFIKFYTQNFSLPLFHCMLWHKCICFMLFSKESHPPKLPHTMYKSSWYWQSHDHNYDNTIKGGVKLYNTFCSSVTVKQRYQCKCKAAFSYRDIYIYHHTTTILYCILHMNKIKFVACPLQIKITVVITSWFHFKMYECYCKKDERLTNASSWVCNHTESTLSNVQLVFIQVNSYSSM